jgi:hypothetical protein
VSLKIPALAGIAFSKNYQPVELLQPSQGWRVIERTVFTQDGAAALLGRF